jgi:hypothetical protein
VDAVLIDVNDTLIPSGAGHVPGAPAWTRFRQVVAGFRHTGRAVGLCSDSPLDQLRSFGRDIGLGGDFPVVAENGNVVAVDGTVRVRAPFPELSEVRAMVVDLGRELGLRQHEDAVAPEFGGRRPDGESWAFGANRRASVSVFGPPRLITAAARRLAERPGLAVDVGVQDTFLGVHPYPDLRGGKARALRRLAADGHRIVMIGNSGSDWVAPDSGVRCGFVGNADVPAAVREAAWAISPLPCLDGVLDLLSLLESRN